MKKIINLLLIGMVGIFAFTACIDDKFDEPTFPFTDPDIAVNTNIREIKSLLGSGCSTEITDDLVFSAVVIANDSLGNFYKKIVVQDSTAGIEILIDGRNLYGKYPVGRRIFIKAKGLAIGSSKGVIQLAGLVSDCSPIGILFKDLDNYIIGGSLNNFVKPKEMKICDYGEFDVSTLVKFTNVQFDGGDLGLTFADAVTKSDKSRTLQDCSGNKFTVRTSGYSEFAADTLPSLKGSLVCVLGIYKYDDQAYSCKYFQGVLRSVDDIVFDAERCGASSGSEKLITIRSVRDLFASGQTIMADDVKIKGIVISDKDNGNLHGKNLVVQDATAGIAIRFSGSHDFNMNDEIEIAISGLEASEYNNLLQFNNVSLEAARVVGTGTITPREATTQQIADNGEEWESTLVKIIESQISGGSVYKDYDVVITDNSGSIDLHTSKYASFADSPLPSGTVKVTAIVGQYKENYQVFIRNLDDVEGGSGPPPSGALFSDDFEGGNLGKWITYSVSGDQVWEHSPKYGNPNSCAKMTGYFDGGRYANEDWLITSEIDLAGKSNAKLTFDNATKYDGPAMQVYVSTDYTGTGDPNSANWTEITYTKSDGNWNWTTAVVELSAYADKKIYFGFKYTSSDSATSTWEIDNVSVK